jgi:ferrous iron transport protein B
LGFGCNVPAVLGTRIIESTRARLLTILLIPLIPCTARLAVLTVLVPIFFPATPALVAWGLVAGNLIILLVLGLVLHRFLFADEHVAFIMELPLYHMPNLKTIGIYVWQNLLGFLHKAGTVILLASLVIWVFSYFPTGEVTTSYLAWFGQILEPVGQWMGLPWTLMLAIITSVAAKENTIATLGILFGNVNQVLPTLITSPAALAFLVFQMLFIPCVGTIAAIQQETRSIRWMALSLLLMLGLSLGIGVAVYQISRIILG